MAAVCRPISYGVLLAAILLLAASAAAQGVGGSIVGSVTDQTQGVLPGVTVTVTGPALMGTRSDVTTVDGTYRLPNLPPGGDYIVVFELAGFASFKREGIRLDVGFTATINATLNPAGLEETVTVSVVARIKARLTTLKVAPGDQPGAEMGPLMTGAHLNRVRGYIDLGVEEGAELVTDGRGAPAAQGFFCGATLFDRVTPSMRIYREE